jgi:hypothetical protein
MYARTGIGDKWRRGRNRDMIKARLLHIACNAPVIYGRIRMSGALISGGTILDASGDEALDAAEGVIDMASVCQTRNLLFSVRDAIKEIRAKLER